MGKLNTNDAVGNVLHGAVYVAVYGSVDGSVWRSVDWAVDGTVWLAVYRVVRRAEDEAAKEDPDHPALDDLLRPIEAEA